MRWRGSRSVPGAPQPAVLAQEAPPLLRLLQDEDDFLGLERLADVVERSRGHRLERGVRVAVGAHDHEGEVRLPRQRLLQQCEPVHAGHPHVGDDRVVVAGLELGERLLAVADRAHLVALRLEHQRQDMSERRLVVRDEDRPEDGHRGVTPIFPWRGPDASPPAPFRPRAR
jgi:hypothetical protein